MNDTKGTKRLNFDPHEIKVLEIAIRTAMNLNVTDDDKAYLASGIAMAAGSIAWSKLSAMRNYCHEMGLYEPIQSVDYDEPDPERAGQDAYIRDQEGR